MKLPFEKQKRKIIVKKEAQTSPKYGIKPSERPGKDLIDYGVVNLDKPSGPTSHQVSAYLKKILHLKKTGHSGTLDPKVTGVLPVALGRATRITNSLLPAGKEYVCLMQLHEEKSKEEIEQVMDEFTGKIKQLPPVKSAVKRQVRQRTIYYIEILDIKGKYVLFRAGTQAGTYIRKLCHDIGKKLKCGGHMVELRRTKAGPFFEDKVVTLQDVADAYYYFKEKGDDSHLKKLIHPIEFAITHLPKIWILDSSVDSLVHGSSLKVPGIVKFEDGFGADDNVAILTLKDELVAVGRSRMTSKEIKRKQTGIAAKPNQVLMNIGIYPKMEK